MRRNGTCSLLIFIATVFSISNSMLTFADLSLEGQVESGIYTSPSGKIRCDIGKFVKSPDFFINDIYEPKVSETMSFAVNAGDYVEIWIVRRQKEGRLDYLPSEGEGFPVTDETFIPYYYSELPYDIKQLEEWSGLPGRSGILQVSMDEDAQLHAYWLYKSNEWLNSIQFVPTLVGAQEQKLELEAVKKSLSLIRDRCVFN